MRKGYIFTVDAILALIVLTIGFLIIFPPVAKTSQDTQAFTLSTELLNRMTNTRLVDFNKESIRNLYEPGGSQIITNPSDPPLSVIVRLQKLGFDFQEAGDLTTAQEYSLQASKVLEEYLNAFLSRSTLTYRLYVEDPINNEILRVGPNQYIYESDAGVQPDQSESLIVQQRIVYFTENGLVQGPFLAKLEVWK